MLTIRTAQTSNASGRGQVVAKGHGKQRTVNIEHGYSSDQNHAAAVGALLNVLTTPEQQAKVRHPSGAKRVRVEHTSEAGGKRKWTIDV